MPSLSSVSDVAELVNSVLLSCWK